MGEWRCRGTGGPSGPFPYPVRRASAARYDEIAHAGAIIELDEFGGELEGLLLAEVEFDTTQASERFEPPDWLGREVTDDASYVNRSLAERGRPA